MWFGTCVAKSVCALCAAQFDTGNNTWQKLQSLIMQLRKCCNHPYLFPGAEPDFDGIHTGALPLIELLWRSPALLLQCLVSALRSLLQNHLLFTSYRLVSCALYTVWWV